MNIHVIKDSCFETWPLINFKRTLIKCFKSHLQAQTETLTHTSKSSAQWHVLNAFRKQTYAHKLRDKDNPCIMTPKLFLSLQSETRKIVSSGHHCPSVRSLTIIRLMRQDVCFVKHCSKFFLSFGNNLLRLR